MHKQIEGVPDAQGGTPPVRAGERRQDEISAAAALAELQEFKQALDAHAIVAVTDLQGRITYANDLFCSISGFSREELLGSDHRIINSGFHPKGFFAERMEELL